MKRVYFDNAATTPIDEAVIEVMQKAMRENYGNPSSIHATGRNARAAIEQARKTVASCIGASIGEVFFTSGGTESNNMALKCSVRDLGLTRIISSPIEHHCVLHSLHTLERSGKAKVQFVQLDDKGRIDLDHLRQLLKSGKDKTMVSLMHANNEIGTMINLDEVGEICAEHQALFHSDTVQTMGYYPFDVGKTNIHFLSGAAHKFYGPKGVGFVYIDGEKMVKPFLDGGAQERNMRAGTENIYGILGLAKALEMAYEELDTRKNQILKLRSYLKQELEQYFPEIQFNGAPVEESHYKVLSVSFPASPRSELLLLNLDIAGISVSGGSACSSGADAGSHVLDALQPGSDRNTIRFSFSYHNTIEEVDFLLGQLKTILRPKETFEV